MKMWTRTDIKQYAKDFLKQNYWKTFFVLLIVAVVSRGFGNSGGSAGVSDFSVNMNYLLTQEGTAPISAEPYVQLFGNIFKSFTPLAALSLGALTLTSVLISLIVLFITFILETGYSQYFIKAYQGDVNFSHLFYGFNSHDYLRIIKAQLLKTLYIFLWSLLFLVPGIVKAYQYRYVNYLLAHNPELSPKEVLKRSKEITHGQKADIFVLDLSFFPYHLLNLISFGIASYFLTPYLEGTNARLFMLLTQDSNN